MFVQNNFAPKKILPKLTFEKITEKRFPKKCRFPSSDPLLLVHKVELIQFQMQYTEKRFKIKDKGR